jgi:acyl-CoA synthetase (AMP-forming)/AMP-acid ligase II
VLVPVSTRFTGPEALDVIGRSRARALFVAGDFLRVDRLGALLRAAEPGDLDRLELMVRMPEEWDAFLQAGSLAEARRRAAAVRQGDVSDIMFTSGTTGRSKGAMTSHERTLGVARAWADCVGLGPDDRYLVMNPFFHTFGFKAGILACLVSGAAIVPQAVFDAGQAMRLIEAERITVLPGAPTIYQMILDHPERGARDLSSLRLVERGVLMADEVLYDQRDRIALITLNRPEYANAQNSAMTCALDAAFGRAVNDDQVGVLVLAGAGKHFCGGHDIGTPGRDADTSFDRRPCCGGTTWAGPERTPGTPARWRSTSACADPGGRSPSPSSR